MEWEEEEEARPRTGTLKRVQGGGRLGEEAGRSPDPTPPLRLGLLPAPCSIGVSHTSFWLPPPHSHRGSRGLSPQCPLFL